MKSNFTKINGIKHHWISWGSPKKPLLLFLHGWMDLAASFHFVCQILKKDYYCVALDWRGFGKSEHTKDPLGYSFLSYAADLHEFIHKISPQSPVKLVGHSMGGNIASFYSGAFPENVSHLINLEGFGLADSPPEEAPKRLRQWIEGRTIRRFKIYPSLNDIASRLRQTNPRITLGTASFLATHISKKVRGGYQIAADPRHKWPSPLQYRLDIVYAYWHQITAKILNVIAAETEMAKWLKNTPDVHKEIRKRLTHFPKGAQEIVLKGCGHMMHHEKPKEVAKLIAKFIEPNSRV